jgi:hypothetical protein
MKGRDYGRTANIWEDNTKMNLKKPECDNGE